MTVISITLRVRNTAPHVRTFIRSIIRKVALIPGAMVTSGYAGGYVLKALGARALRTNARI
ncbi:protein of unknown function [Pseudomonas mediterranea]